MSSEEKVELTKKNIDLYLKEVAKEYRKQVGKKMPAELILIGGASVLINYGFRNMTSDIDALILAASAMKDAINHVGDRYGLPKSWLNDDFTNTDSYSVKLLQFSAYYKTYANIMTVRTIAAEYLIAMKLRSGRQYKRDMSDILGILSEHEKRGAPISMDRIRNAVSDLYGSWETLPKNSQDFIENIMEDGRFELLYEKTLNSEIDTGVLLNQFEQDYPGLVTGKNINEIAENLQKKANRTSVFTRLQENKVKIEQTESTARATKRDDPER